MKLLLDENLPKRIKAELLPNDVWTVQKMGWRGKTNGELLRLMKFEGFEALMTFDKNLVYQQNFPLCLHVIVLDAPDNTFLTLKPLIAKVMDAIANSEINGLVVIR
ncbi:MAG: DUF5615 family PIN-like protein [Flavobacteriales bacterium]|nr:DUF5615 family PIN-like protein [Flavobacteriales bacterium]